MSSYADEHYLAYVETERKARKPHICDACHEPIPPRHRYFFVSWVFDGRADSVKRCLRCQAIHLHLRQLGKHDDMWPSETLSCGEEYTEHWGKEPPEHIARMAFLSPDERQEIAFRVFRNKRGDHFIARSLEEAYAHYEGDAPLEPLTEVPGDVGIPIVVDGRERFLHDYYSEQSPERTPMKWHELGLKELRQPHDFRSAREWAIECGVGRLCSGDPVLPLQGPYQRLDRWGR